MAARTLELRTPTLSRLWLALLLLAALVACRDATPPLRGANVLVVVVDALAAGHLGLYGYERQTSPFIDSLARRSVVFDAATSASSHTVPSTLSLFASRHPGHHGNDYYPLTRSFRRPEPGLRPQISPSMPLLAELFRDGGYRTIAATANPWIRERYGFTRGFEDFHFLPAEHRSPRAPLLDAIARDVFDADDERPFLLYLHYMDVHNPYLPPPPFRARFTEGLRGQNLRSNGPMPDALPDDVAVTRALYDGEIRAFDAALEELVAALDASGQGASTLIVFTSDHGEEFHEHGGMGHGWTLFEESVHVPLFFFHPALQAARIEQPTGTVDLLPTLLDLVGLPVPKGLDGVSLAPLILGNEGVALEDRPVISELGDVKAVRWNERKLIWSEREGGLHPPGFAAYDLSTDAREQAALAEPAWQERLAGPLEVLRESARAARAASRSEDDSSAGEVPEPWFEEQLRALGYVE